MISILTDDELVLALRSDLRISTFGESLVLICTDELHLTLRHPVFIATLRVLVRPTSMGIILERLGRQFDSAVIYFAVSKLKSVGAIYSASNRNRLRVDELWSRRGISSEGSKLSINVIGCGDVQTEALCKSLEQWGHPIETDADVGILVVQSLLDDRIPKLGETIAERYAFHTIVSLSIGEAFCGPLYKRQCAGCVTCLSRRVRQLDSVRALARSIRTPSDAHFEDQYFPQGELLSAFAAGYLADGLARIISSELKIAQSKYALLNLKFWSVRLGTATPYASCAICGTPSDRIHKAIDYFESETSNDFQNVDGGHRTVSAIDTTARLRHIVDPLAGVVPALRAATELPAGIHVYFSGHNWAVPPNLLGEFVRYARKDASGKGMSREQAEASALCEAVERYSAVQQGWEVDCTESYTDIARIAIHPNDVMLFSEQQFADSARKLKKGFSRVPEQFDVSAKVDWSPVWSLADGSRRLLPSALLYFSAAECSRFNGHQYCLSDSNGNAAGNTYQEAVLQGLFELVERDAVAIWWYNRISRPALSPSNSLEYSAPWRTHRDIGRDVWLLNLTSDLGIPVIAAVSADSGTGRKPIFGFGCHFNLGVATTRAVTEMNQQLPRLLKAKRQESGSLPNDDMDAWLSTASTHELLYLAPSNPERLMICDDVEPNRLSLGASIDVVVDVLRTKGIDVYVLDQSRRETDLVVVKVIAPGLRHFWARFAPGRLYDVPVATKLINKPLEERNLNPIPMFL